MASKSKKAKVAEIEATQGFADTQAFAAAAVGRGALDSDDDADNRKRAREDDEDDYEAGAGAGAGAKPSAKSSRAEQSASADADGADTDEEGPSTPVKASTAASVKTRHALPVPANARAGAILRISLKNIRCHANLEFNLNPATNFIIGRNGSGKSSVLVGARLALGWSPGAKSGDVSVIKEGCQGAKAEIDLCNTGKDAYKPLEYGQIIRISREMPLASDGKKLGTSRWEIRNGITGELKAKGPEAKKLLQVLIDHLNIRPDNPVMIMDQETSKKFLVGDKREQYEFFLLATSLKANFEAIADTKKQMYKTEGDLASKKLDLQRSDAKLKEVKAAYEAFAKLGSIETAIKEAELDVAWAKVADGDRDVAAHEMIVKQHAEAIARFETKKESAEGLLEKKKKEKRAAEEALSEATEKLKGQEDLLDAAGEEADKVAHAMKDARKKEAVAKRDLDNATKQLDRYKRDMREFEDEVEARKAKAKKTDKASVLADAKARAAAASLEVQAAIDEQTSAKAALEAAQREVEAAKSSSQRANEDVQEARSCVEHFEEQLKAPVKKNQPIVVDPLSSFRASGNYRVKNAAKIADLISANKNRFSVVPVGPIAAHVKLRDFSFAEAFEAHCPINLHFLAHSNADAQALENLAKSAGIQIQVTRRPQVTKPMSVRNVPGAAGSTTLLDILDIDDPWVMAAVMDATTPERVILADNQDDAIAKIGRKGADGVYHGMKDGVKCAITRDCRRITYGHSGFGNRAMSSEDKSAAPYVRRSDPVSPAGAGAGAASSSSAAVDPRENIRRDLADAKVRLEQAVRTAAEASSRVKSKEFNLQSASKNVSMAEKDVNVKRNRASAAVEVMKQAKALPDDDDQDDDNADDERRASVQANIDSAAAEVERLAAELQQASSKVEALLPDVEEAAKRVKELKDAADGGEEVKAAKQAVKDVTEAVHKVEAALQQVSTVLAKAISDHEEANDKLEGMVSARDQLKTDAKLATGRSGPSQKSIDEGWGASLEEAQKHVRGLKASFEIAQKKLGKVKGADYESIKTAMSEISAEYMRDTLALKDVTDIHTKLAARVKEQMAHFYVRRGEVCESMRKEFIARMAQKGHKAEIHFRHGGSGKHRDAELDDDLQTDEGEIHVDTITDAVGRGLQHQDVKEHGQSVGMLSGGEKSYTSAILLSAIAKVANPPFRLIDEFDVYQDEETRRKTMTMILADAKAVPDSDGLRMQYILLTPHDVSSAVPLNEDWLTVHRMKDPRREGGAGAGAGDP